MRLGEIFAMESNLTSLGANRHSGQYGAVMGEYSNFGGVMGKTLESKISSSLNSSLCPETWELQNFLFFELGAGCSKL